MLLLTQSRGPIIAPAGGRLYAAPASSSPAAIADRRGAGRAGSAAFGHDAGGRHAARPFRGAGDSGLRLSIWHHTLSEMASQPWLGRGFSYELDFINYSGEHHHHPQRLSGALLKGGIVGSAAAVGGHCLRAMAGVAQTPPTAAARYSLAILFTRWFYGVAGCLSSAIPRNPVLFWLPLGIALSNRVGGETAKGRRESTKRAVSGPFILTAKRGNQTIACSLIIGHRRQSPHPPTFAFTDHLSGLVITRRPNGITRQPGILEFAFVITATIGLSKARNARSRCPA